VFDCNVYLDVANLTGRFGWDTFSAEVARLAQVPVPHPTDRAYDALRAVAACTSGRLVGDEILEVWTSDHIDSMVHRKAVTPATPDEFGHVGLGWSTEDADELVDELIGGLCAASNGGTVGGHYPDGNPPLDHEDGMVYGACRWLASDDPLCRVYCVTRDRGFLKAYRDNRLDPHTVVLTPSNFVAFARKARRMASLQQMRPQ